MDKKVVSLLRHFQAGIEEVLINRLDSSILNAEQNHKVFQMIRETLEKDMTDGEFEEAEYHILHSLSVEFTINKLGYDPFIDNSTDIENIPF
jgi:hypothetical protein